MPAKENVLLLSDNETKLIRKDVDNLVQNIKDNLKLNFEAVSFEKGGGKTLPHLDYPTDLVPSCRKARSYMSAKSSRASPYSVPGKGGNCDCDESGRNWAARKRYPSMSANGKQKLEIEDPLEMLHELIRYVFAGLDVGKYIII